MLPTEPARHGRLAAGQVRAAEAGLALDGAHPERYLLESGQLSPVPVQGQGKGNANRLKAGEQLEEAQYTTESRRWCSRRTPTPIWCTCRSPTAR